LRGHHADVVDLCQPIGEARGYVRRHLRGLRVGAGDRHHRNGQRRWPRLRPEHQCGQHGHHAEPGQGGERRSRADAKQPPWLRRRSRCGGCLRFNLYRLRQWRRRLVGRCGRFCRHPGVEQIATAGNQLDQLALIVAERTSKLPDTLEQIVLADPDVRPDRFHQLLLAQQLSGVGGKQRQHVEGLRPKLDGFAVGPAQFGALVVKLETAEAQHRGWRVSVTVQWIRECQKSRPAVRLLTPYHEAQTA
jgi:hypothetical protein